MRYCLWTLLAFVLSQRIPAVCAAEQPRALIERALKTEGVEAIPKPVAVRVRVTGKLFDKTGGGDFARIEGEILEFRGRSKANLTLFLKTREVVGRFTIVSNGEKSWFAVNDQVQEPSKDDLASHRVSQYVDRVTDLEDLLTDKGFTLAPLADAKVEGRPARGVKVSYKDRPDVSLYFDKETGLLVKYCYRAPKAGAEKEVLHETVLSDYRVPDVAAADEKILREGKGEVSGPALLALLRARTPSAAKLDRARRLIPKLGDETFAVREQASHDLIALGALAIPFLREATKNNDPEIVRRARDCLQAIGEDRSKAQIAAAIRLVGLRQPAGAAEVLLDYLPSADADLAAEVQAALYAIAQAKREPDPVLVRALDDKNELRRRAAAAALGKDGGAYARQPGRRLFTSMPKRPRKHKSWIDGKLDMEMETFDYQFFNAFEDKVFAKP